MSRSVPNVMDIQVHSYSTTPNTRQTLQVSVASTSVAQLRTQIQDLVDKYTINSMKWGPVVFQLDSNRKIKQIIVDEILTKQPEFNWDTTPIIVTFNLRGGS